MGDIVGLVTVVDPDNVDPDSPIQTHNCSVGGDGLGVFTIDHGSNNLKVNETIIHHMQNVQYEGNQIKSFGSSKDTFCGNCC